MTTTMNLAQRSTRRILVVAAGWLWGCGPTILIDEDTESAADDMTSSSTGVVEPPNPVTTTPPPPPPGDTTSSADSSTTEPGVDFIADPDGGDDWFECDLWLQDCPRGEKCMPWALDGGGSWNAWRCSPLARNPGERGDPCTVERSAVSGIDDCELGAMCWDVDPETLEGVCADLCSGDESSPTCEHPNDTCRIAGDAVLPICLPNCDPLVQDCAEGQACVEVSTNFQCVPDASGDMGIPGDPCEFVNMCDPGAFCAATEFVPGCVTGGCCTSYCEVGDPMPPCLPGQICAPYYPDGEAPPGYELVGACAVP